MTNNEKEETVYVSVTTNGTSPSVFHTDRECPRLASANGVHEYSRGGVGRRECRVCRGTYEPSEGDFGYRDALLAADAEDLP